MKRAGFRGFALLVCALAILCIGCAPAGGAAAPDRVSTLRKVLDRGTLIVGLEAEFYPFEYVEDGRRNCLLLVFRDGTAGAQHGEMIASQYADWLRRLAATFEESGQKPKRSQRSASELLSGLYGALVTARLTGNPGTFKRQAKRLKKTPTA